MKFIIINTAETNKLVSKILYFAGFFLYIYFHMLKGVKDHNAEHMRENKLRVFEKNIDTILYQIPFAVVI